MRIFFGVTSIATNSNIISRKRVEGVFGSFPWKQEAATTHERFRVTCFSFLSVLLRDGISLEPKPGAGGGFKGENQGILRIRLCSM